MNNRHNHHHAHHQNPSIVVHDNDVLCGRGVNIAHHSGNERFRTLIYTRKDEAYCTSYSASEKRAVAEEVIRHIKVLNPPGRFLKRDGRGQVSRGLNGPWEELTERESVKKTCQALRDCNRQDRAGYALGVIPPTDVIRSATERASMGLSGKQQAAAAAATAASKAAAVASATLKRTRDQINSSSVNVIVGPGPNMPAEENNTPPISQSFHHDYHMPSASINMHPLTLQAGPNGRLSPSVEPASEWLKKQRRHEDDISAAVNNNGIHVMNSMPNFSHGIGGDGMLAPPPLPDHPEPNSYENYTHQALENAVSETNTWHTERNVNDTPSNMGTAHSNYGLEEAFYSRSTEHHPHQDGRELATVAMPALSYNL